MILITLIIIYLMQTVQIWTKNVPYFLRCKSLKSWTWKRHFPPRKHPLLTGTVLWAKQWHNERLCSFYLETCRILSHYWCGHLIPQISSQSIMIFVECSSNACTTPGSATSTTWSSVWWKKWRHFSQGIINRAARQWHVQLRAHVCENGGHFEYKL